MPTGGLGRFALNEQSWHDHVGTSYKDEGGVEALDQGRTRSFFLLERSPGVLLHDHRPTGLAVLLMKMVSTMSLTMLPRYKSVPT